MKEETAGARRATGESQVRRCQRCLLLAEPPKPGPGAYSFRGGASCASQQRERLSCVCVRRGRLQDLCMPLNGRIRERCTRCSVSSCADRDHQSQTEVFFFPCHLFPPQLDPRCSAPCRNHTRRTSKTPTWLRGAMLI